ncbi:MAG: thermonuclease family protein [Bdellovibrionales bacterium]|nr:thermonuclease family protein [Bdellovibrionales bacterium]
MGKLGLWMALALLLAITSARADTDSYREDCDRQNPPPAQVQVERVVDGDTIYVRSGKKSWSVRMLGIDTPETHYLGKSQGYWGEKAHERLEELLPVGSKVRLEFTDEICDQNRRVLAHVWKGKRYVHEVMVEEGLAVNYCYFPNLEHCGALGDAANESVAERRGFFGDPSVELPYIWRRRIRGEASKSLVGDRDTHLVYGFDEIDRVPVGNRVFFSNGKKPPAPWQPRP